MCLLLCFVLVLCVCLCLRIACASRSRCVLFRASMQNRGGGTAPSSAYLRNRRLKSGSRPGAKGSFGAQSTASSQHSGSGEGDSHSNPDSGSPSPQTSVPGSPVNVGLAAGGEQGSSSQDALVGSGVMLSSASRYVKSGGSFGRRQSPGARCKHCLPLCLALFEPFLRICACNLTACARLLLLTCSRVLC